MRRLTVTGLVLTLGAHAAFAQSLPANTHDAVVSGPNDASMLIFLPALDPSVAAQYPARKQEAHGADMSGKSGGNGLAGNGSSDSVDSSNADAQFGNDRSNMDTADPGRVLGTTHSSPVLKYEVAK